MNKRPGQCGAERMVIAMDLTERTLESRSIFEGKIVTLLVDQAELPMGNRRPGRWCSTQAEWRSCRWTKRET